MDGKGFVCSLFPFLMFLNPAPPCVYLVRTRFIPFFCPPPPPLSVGLFF
jgi:hypothetical protein